MISDSKYFTKNKGFQLMMRLTNMSFVFLVSSFMVISSSLNSKRDNASHLLLRLTPSLTPVGTIRCIKLAPFTYKLTRLAVLKTYRNQNLGRSLILAFHNHVKAQARMELIDNTTSTDNTTPSNFANNSVQSSTKPIPNSKACADSLLARTMTITSDDHPDQDPISGSISMPSNVPVSSAKIIAHSQIPVQDFYAR